MAQAETSMAQTQDAEPFLIRLWRAWLKGWNRKEETMSYFKNNFDSEDRNEYAKKVLPEQLDAHAGYLDKARKAAIELAKRMGAITIDDVWDACPPPNGVDPRILGGVFRGKNVWRISGYRKSRRSALNHGRSIAVWELVQIQGE